MSCNRRGRAQLEAARRTGGLPATCQPPCWPRGGVPPPERSGTVCHSPEVSVGAAAGLASAATASQRGAAGAARPLPLPLPPRQPSVSRLPLPRPLPLPPLPDLEETTLYSQPDRGAADQRSALRLLR